MLYTWMPSEHDNTQYLVHYPKCPRYISRWNASMTICNQGVFENALSHHSPSSFIPGTCHLGEYGELYASTAPAKTGSRVMSQGELRASNPAQGLGMVVLVPSGLKTDYIGCWYISLAIVLWLVSIHIAITTGNIVASCLFQNFQNNGRVYYSGHCWRRLDLLFLD